MDGREGDGGKKGKREERKYQWVVEIKGRDDEKKTNTLKVTTAGDKKEDDKEKQKNLKKSEDAEKRSSSTWTMEIEEASDHAVVVLC